MCPNFHPINERFYLSNNQSYLYYPQYQNNSLQVLSIQSIYTHATPKCNISKANCADICGLKLQGSYYRLIFYNNANWGKEPCPSRPDSVFICKEAAKAFHSMRTSPLHMLRLIIDHRVRSRRCFLSIMGIYPNINQPTINTIVVNACALYPVLSE